MSPIPSRLLSIVALLALSVFPGRAQADPITVTGGFLSSVGLGNVGRFEMTAPGVSLVGSTDMGNVSPAACYPCEAGDVVSMSTVLFGGLQLDRPALIDGSPFEGTVGASFEFLSPSIVVPSAAANFTVRQMFTFSATVTGEIDQNTVFSRLLNGQGLLTANFAHNPNIADVTAFEFSDIRYDFTEPAPVPEPMTLLLVGSGLGALALRRRRGGRSSASSGNIR